MRQPQTATAEPPTTLSEADYRQTYEPLGWKLLVIGPTSTWREEWGEWEAIRDLVQNSLDETEAYRFGWDKQGLWIEDQGRGVAVSDFLLGPPKLKPPYARGRFGEGMKIASLALLRKGYKVKVETVGRELWMVFYEQKVDGTAPTLAALWRPHTRTQGTRFHIIGYQGSAFDERFAVNLSRHVILHEGPSPLHEPIPRQNQLIGEPYQGMVYARDIFMTVIKSPWSYNLWGFEMAPDRHGPKEATQMHQDMGRLWATVKDQSLLERLLPMLIEPPREKTYESDSLTFDWMGKEPASGHPYRAFMSENAAVWQRAWNKAIGAGTVLTTDVAVDHIVRHLGYEPVRVRWAVSDGLTAVVRTDKALLKESEERLREAQVVADTELTPRELAHLNVARAITGRAVYRPPRAVHAAIIPPASDRTRTAGMYGRVTQEIFISREQLERLSNTIDVTIHELAHHSSGADDLTEGHSNALSTLGAKVADLVARGDLDHVLTGELFW